MSDTAFPQPLPSTHLTTGHFKRHAALLSPPPASEGTEPQNQHIQEALSYSRNARQLSKHLLHTLSKTVVACERFLDDDAITFKDLPESENGGRSIPNIKQTLRVLQALKQTLEGVARECEEVTRDVSLHPRGSMEQAHAVHLLTYCVPPNSLRFILITQQSKWVIDKDNWPRKTKLCLWL